MRAPKRDERSRRVPAVSVRQSGRLAGSRDERLESIKPGANRYFIGWIFTGRGIIMFLKKIKPVPDEVLERLVYVVRTFWTS